MLPSLCANQEMDLHEEFDFVVLKYISQMLMEEDIDEKNCMFQESSALEAAEQSLYELIGEKYPSTDDSPIPCADQKNGSPDDNHALQCERNSSSSGCTRSTSGINTVDSDRNFDQGESRPAQFAFEYTSQSSSSSNGSGNTNDGIVDSPQSTLEVPEIFNDIESVMQFKRGFEEASKFLPNLSSLIVDVASCELSSKESKETKDKKVEAGKSYESEYLLDGARGKKNPHSEDVNLDGGRSNKQSSVCSESTVSPEMFDMILLNSKPCGPALPESLRNGTSKTLEQDGQSKDTNGGKARGKKRGGKRGVVDLRTLLTLCAQAVSSNDRRSADEFLKQIRQNSSPKGDSMQRTAHYFANGLEARMAGTGTKIYRDLTKLPSAADILKAYHLLLATCPFMKLCHFFSNRTIMKVAEKATRLHIIDLGIRHGFQWPCLIQNLSSRPNGPPKLRITGVDFPQPGFRPAERTEETGRRLANYAKTFNVPFEFNAIAKKWENIQIEELKLDPDEVLVVNCMYRLKNLLDETVMVESPKDIVLNLIRKMNPKVFIMGTINGVYSAPFFITRFREALFHFSALFDMAETSLVHDTPERTLLERLVVGQEAMNVIACEGAERIERPETYKQWQLRCVRAGLRQLPLNPEILKKIKDILRLDYHKYFVVDEDGEWLLHGWKGRTGFALSSWIPTC
ncbi:hypothetical protein UlMin_025640 [Ulmus minor]